MMSYNGTHVSLEIFRDVVRLLGTGHIQSDLGIDVCRMQIKI